jgi:hypothetical protein
MEVITSYVEGLWGDLASSIADNMIDAFLETGDAAGNLEKVVKDMSKNMAKSMIQDLLMKEIFTDDLQTRLIDMLKGGDQDKANALIEDAINSANELAPVIEGIITSLGLTSEAAEGARGATAKGIANASQESVDDLNGRFTAIQGHTYSLMESSKMLVLNSNIALDYLASINSNTSRLMAIETDMRNVRDSLSDMATKGIKIKS